MVGCELIHHSGSDHVALSTAETIGAATVFLGLPVMAVLLARREASGARRAAVLGAVACRVSPTQWSLMPSYTALEAGGFAVLGRSGLAWASGSSEPAIDRGRRGLDEPTTPVLARRAGAPG